MSARPLIPLASADVTEREIEAVTAVLRSGRLACGPRVEEFEAAMARAAGAEHGVATSSGTAGLHLCVRALGIGPGDEVLVPSFTFVAVANAVLYERAKPVFVDIDPTTLNLDVLALERAVGPRTRAIVAVHTFGRPAPMDAILAVARRHRLAVIEDACEAIGARDGGRPVGARGNAGVFAFYPNKQVTTGEGGMVVTRDEALARRIRSLRNQGRAPEGGRYEHGELGWNYRMDEMSAALGVAQLARLDEILALREAAARGYDRRLQACLSIKRPALDHSGGRVSWFVYVVQFDPGGEAPASDEEAARERDRILHALNLRGIECGRYFAPLHLQPFLRGASGAGLGCLPVTERVAARALALPFYNRIRDVDQDGVCEALAAALAEGSPRGPAGG